MAMQWIRRVLRLLWDGLKVVHSLVFGIISVLIVVAVVAAIATQKSPHVPDGGALVLNPSGALVEQKSALEPAALLQSGEVPHEVLVKDIIDALALAKTDDRIGLLVLDMDDLSGGLLPKLERISRAIVDFKQSGKKVIAVGDFYTQSGLFLAVQADEVLLDPEGIALPEGFGTYRTYYKTLLENFDVSVNLFKVGKYKSAAEPFFRDNMSDEDREARLAILSTWWNAYTTSVETARNLTEGSVDEWLHDMPNQIRQVSGNLAQLSLKVGMIDLLVTRDERRAYLKELAGEDEETGEYRRISFADYLAVSRKPVEHKSSKVAVITAVGGIVDGEAKAGGIGSSSLTKLIRKAHKDDKVKAIVLRVDSGGGSKTASEVIRRELEYVQEQGIPVVASMGSVAASGGYWISATADQIWALPTTVTGSIGIFGLIPTIEKTLARYGIHSDGVATTPLAGGVSIERGVSDFYGQIIQEVIEAGYSQFLTTVARGRNMTTDAVNEIAQGRVWSGEKALELGLVDEMGDLEQAIEAAAGLANLEDYSVWYVEHEKSTQEQILQELMSEAAILHQESGVNPVSELVRHIKRELEFLRQLNDPQGAYVICAACPMNP
jgi:protease IV